MGEQITAVEELIDGRGGTQGGFQVTTTDQVIWLGIENFQSCCEDWGYLLSEDDPQKFVGAELRGIMATDTNRTSRRICPAYDYDSGDELDDDAVYLDDGEAMFIDLETDRGVLQFAAYNGHNGCYGHEVTVESRQLKLDKVL